MNKDRLKQAFEAQSRVDSLERISGRIDMYRKNHRHLLGFIDPSGEASVSASALEKILVIAQADIDEQLAAAKAEFERL